MLAEETNTEKKLTGCKWVTNLRNLYHKVLFVPNNMMKMMIRKEICTSDNNKMKHCYPNYHISESLNIYIYI